VKREGSNRGAWCSGNLTTHPKGQASGKFVLGTECRVSSRGKKPWGTPQRVSLQRDSIQVQTGHMTSSGINRTDVQSEDNSMKGGVFTGTTNEKICQRRGEKKGSMDLREGKI